MCAIPRALFGLILSCFAGAVPAATASFDVYTVNLSFPPYILFVFTYDGEPMNTAYLNQGVTFGCFNGTDGSFNLCVDAANGGNAYARATTNPASSPHVVHLSATGVPFFDERSGYLKASFSSVLGEVSVDAQPVTPPEGSGVTVNRPFLQAFNSQGQHLATVSYSYGTCDPNTTQCPWQTLTIRRPQNDIKFVAFSSYSSSGGIVYGQFDNVAFNLVDSDGDGLQDNLDNCRLIANPNQLDGDADGYGNVCDADLNNSGLVTSADFNLLRSVLNQTAGSSALAAAADLNGSGLVTATDFSILRGALNQPPGPSGYHPNCPPTCP